MGKRELERCGWCTHAIEKHHSWVKVGQVLFHRWPCYDEYQTDGAKDQTTDTQGDTK